MASNGGRSGKDWEAARKTVLDSARLQPEPTICALCGRTIDPDRPYRLPNGTVDPDSPSIDHITPVTDGGAILDPDNLRLVHLTCNHKQGGHIRDQQEQDRNRTTSLGTPSRTW